MDQAKDRSEDGTTNLTKKETTTILPTSAKKYASTILAPLAVQEAGMIPVAASESHAGMNLPVPSKIEAIMILPTPIKQEAGMIQLRRIETNTILEKPTGCTGNSTAHSDRMPREHSRMRR